MENLARYPTIVLRVKIHDCDECPKKLRKILLQLDGVHWVDVEPKKEKVTVIAEVDDPTTLIKYLERKKIKAELLSYDRNKDKSEKKEKNKNVGGNQKERHTCGHGDQGDVEEKDHHKAHVIEAYKAPEGDPTVCRDLFCQIHKRRPIFHYKVPPVSSADHPRHNQGYRFPGPNTQDQALTFEDPNLLFDAPMMEPQMLPPSHSGFCSRLPEPGSHFMPEFRNFSGYPGGGSVPYPRSFGGYPGRDPCFRGSYM